MKKTLSLILAVLMIMATMPMALAAPVSLTKTNITEYPVANGEIYFGQSIGEALTISGGKVEYNGVEVAGHFEALSPETRADKTGDIRVDIKFIPDDETAYSGFSVTRNRNTTSPVLLTTPLFVDKENDPVVATSIDPGSALSSSILSGGTMYNPYYAEEPKVAASAWGWTDPTAVVIESGYYEAFFVPDGYVKQTEQVWVEVNKTIIETEVREVPAAIELTYGDVTTYGELTFSGVAVEKGTDKIVEGTFAPNDLWATAKVNVGTHNVAVAFTPDDTENYLGTECTVTVTVNPAIPTWKDGEAVITVPYGTKIDSSFDWYVTNALDDSTDGLLRSWGYKTIDGAEITGDFLPTVGTHEVTANLNLNGTGSQNYQTDTMMTFTLVVEGKTLDCILEPMGSEGYKIVDESLAYNATKPQGTFTITGPNGEYTAKYGEIFKLAESASGTYTYEIKYNPIENDPFIIADFTSEQNVICTWKATIGEAEKTYIFGETISLSSDEANFSRWNITDASGNPIDVVIVSGSLESASVVFTMPDCDIIVTSEANAATGGDLGIGDIDGIDGFIEWFNNLFAKIKAFFEKIIAFFRGIGDMS